MKRQPVDLSVRIEKSVKDSARAAVVALRGTDHAVEGGVSGMVERLLAREVRRLERRHNDGEPFAAVDRMPAGPGI